MYAMPPSFTSGGYIYPVPLSTPLLGTIFAAILPPSAFVTRRFNLMGALPQIVYQKPYLSKSDMSLLEVKTRDAIASAMLPWYTRVTDDRQTSAGFCNAVTTFCSANTVILWTNYRSQCHFRASGCSHIILFNVSCYSGCWTRQPNFSTYDAAKWRNDVIYINRHS